MRCFFLWILIGIGIIFTPNMLAQVTIGSEEPPLEGALLDLKNKKPEISDHPLINANKGLLLPRVKLQKIDDLFPMFTGDELDYESQKKQHIGLLVYNVNTTDSPFNLPEYGIGNYVWNGTEWTKVKGLHSQVPNSQGTEMSDPIMYSYNDIYEPNSYIMLPGVQSTPIRVAKAYAMWEKYKIPANSKIGADKTLSQFKGITLTTGVSIRILWQDNPNLLRNANITQTGTGRDATFTITPASGQTGNAIVGAFIDNQIRWSWHIWVTTYNPEITNHTLVNTTNANKYILMDRNLGANNNTAGNAASMGLMYQWGRKDPFPRAESLTSLVKAPLYNESGAISSLPTSAVVVADLNLVESIVNPTTYYQSNATPSTTGSSTFDWYTNLGYTNVTGDRTAIMNDQLWDENERKAPFDPCPQGWRVPTFKNDLSPWLYIPSLHDISPIAYGNTADFYSVFSLQFTGKIDYAIGTYPASGTIVGETFKYYKVGETGYYWSAEPSTDAINYSFALRFNGQSFNGRESLYRAEGASIRCVKE